MGMAFVGVILYKYIGHFDRRIGAFLSGHLDLILHI